MASLDTEYGTETVAGKAPVVKACIEARPEDMLMNRGSDDHRRSGMKAVVIIARGVAFSSKCLLYTMRSALLEEFGARMFALATLMMSTIVRSQRGDS
jgi:hypothetical protein